MFGATFKISMIASSAYVIILPVLHYLKKCAKRTLSSPARTPVWNHGFLPRHYRLIRLTFFSKGIRNELVEYGTDEKTAPQQ